MSTFTTLRNYAKAAGTDNWRTFLKTTLAATMDLLDADMTAALAPVNLLVNPGFEVFQRGGTITANNAYAHDRWQISLGASSTISVTDETTIVDTGSGHALKAVYTHSAVTYLDQKIEHYLQLRGRTLTFAIRVRKGVASSVRPYIQDTGARTYGATSTTTGSFTTMTVTLAIGAAATSVTAGVELSISDTVYLDSATLCVGSVAVPYTPLTPPDDLARCKRYYWEIGGLSATEFACLAQALSTTVALGVILFPVEMAVAPTITVSAAADWTLLSAGGTGLACTVLSASSITRRNARIDPTVASGLVAGNATVLWANSTVNARLKFEANP